MMRTLHKHHRPDPARIVLTPARLFWLGLMGAVIGALVETLFMLLTRGQLYNRSSLLWGQVSLVWGAGAVVFTLVLRRYIQKGGWAVFLAGAFWGTVCELCCSLGLEYCFGVIFWDYSHLPLSLGGRINLFFSCYWGAAATVWTLWILPWLSAFLDKFPARALHWGAALVALLLAFDVAATCLALLRLGTRQAGLPPQNGLEQYFDVHWNDQRLAERFRHMRYMEDSYREHPDFW